jgi:16S rRNA (guanine1207-N2)-methyltransferase
LSTEGGRILVSPMDSFQGGLSRFAHKTVSFRFAARELSFRLSHALFSSFDIDDGSRLLLKSLARRIDLGGLRSALDIGCGIGVLGACIASQAPDAKVVMQDRDALAAAFARENCRANGLESVEAVCSLAFWGLGGRAFDLVTSNLPAKAGKPVLRSFLRHAAGCLAPHGIAAVVIVAPLASFVRETLAVLGCEIVVFDQTASYAAIHFRAGTYRQESDVEREDLSPYLRATAMFTPPGLSYSLQTAYSLPDFDNLGHALALSFDVLKEAAPARRVCAWNPGQGHLPVGLLAQPGRQLSSISIASRDFLQCAITGLNIASRGFPPANVRAICSEADLGASFASGSFDLLVAAPDPIPGAAWQAELARSAASLLRPGGGLFVVGTSTEMHRFLDRDHGLRVRTSRKKKGFRAALLQKP